MSIESSVWGPHFWYVLHSIAITYPDKPSKAAMIALIDMMTGMSALIPCPICKEHFIKIVKSGIGGEGIPKLSDVATCRYDFFRWVYDVHDFVNRKKLVPNGVKRTESPPFKAVLNYWNTQLVDRGDMLII